MTSGLETHKARRLAQGFDEDSVEVMLQARKCSTNAAYQGYWQRFCFYCEARDLDPYETTIMEIVGFVESCRREKSWKFPTIKVCVSALSTFRGKIGGFSVFTHPDMSEYLEGAKRISVEKVTLPDTWDPAVVLRAMEGPPFEPLATADMKWVSGKLAVLLLLTTAARVSEMAALMASRIDFSVNDEQVTIYPDPEFKPKTVDLVYSRAPLVVKAFFPVPRTMEERRYNLSCPVRAVRCYLDRTKAVRKSHKLLVSYRKRSPGLAITSQRLAHWLVDAVSEAYTRANKPVPKLTAHSTRPRWPCFRVRIGMSFAGLRPGRVTPRSCITTLGTLTCVLLVMLS